MSDGGHARHRRPSIVAAGAALLAVAATCAACGTRLTGDDTAGPFPSVEINPAPQPDRPIAARFQPVDFTADCALARPRGADPPMTPPEAGSDLRLGPLWYAGRPPYQLPDQPGAGDDRGTFVKVGAMVTAGARATISVDPSARDRVGIVVETGRTGGYPTVHYRGCPDRPVWWVGGFVVADGRPVCLPVTVRDDRRGTVQHHRVGLGVAC